MQHTDKVKRHEMQWRKSIHAIRNMLNKPVGFLRFPAHMKTTTLPSKDSISRSSRPPALLLIALALVCFALSPTVKAACQDACLTNSNTVQGDDALISLLRGSD